jgi:2-methylcitrate dehydratase PrpD
MSSKEPVSAVLADWIAALDANDLPPAVRVAGSDTLLDTIGLIVAALDTDYGQSVRQAFPDTGSATIFGLGEGRAFSAAATINGTCGHGEDFDNTFEGCPVHSGVVVVPAMTAAAEALGLDNAAVAKGIAVGMEVMCRLGLVANKAVHTAGFHPTAILGTMGAAAGVAAAMGQTPRQIRDTLGVAGSMASGIIEYLADGSWTKRMHAGWSAQAAIRAAMMGDAGFSGPGTVFEGVHGLFSAFAPSIVPEFRYLTGDLGSRWEMASVAYKPYACGTMTQPYIDCAIRLGRAGIAPADIEEITCEVGEGTVHRLWEPLSEKQRPTTSYSAKFSTPYCVAVGIIYQDAGLAEFTEQRVREPQILELAGKVNYVVDPDNEYPANYTGHVRARLKDGSVVEERQPCMRGGAREPLSRDELEAKCAANIAFAGRPRERVAAISDFADRTMAAEGTFNAASLNRELLPATPQA